MIVYGSTMSPYVRKVVALARELDMDFALQSVGFQDPDPDFREASPLGKMPALRDGDYHLADSTAICLYLDAKANGGLLPEDAKARGTVMWWDEFADTVLMDAGRKLFFNRVVAPHFLKIEGDLAEADHAEAQVVPPLLDMLETRVPDAGGFLVGERLSLADLSLASPFVNLAHAGFKWPDEKWPRTRSWVAAILERPSFSVSIAKEEAFFEKMRG